MTPTKGVYCADCGGHRLHAVRELGALARDRLRLVRLVPQRRVLDPGVQFVETAERGLPVKVSS